MPTRDPFQRSAPAYDQSAARRRWLRLIIALIVFNAVVLAGILAWRYVSPGRITIDPTGAAPVTTVPARGGGALDSSSEGADGSPPPVDDPARSPSSGEPAPVEQADPVTFLVMGSDTRENLPEELGITDQLVGHRADVIMVVKFDGDRIRVLSLPRDLRVEVAGAPRKLNAAYSIDGPNPQLLFDTVVAETGIDIDYYLELDFFGFAGVVDGLGGIEMTFPYPARDLKSDLNVGAGRRHLDGRTALAYARSRQYQEYRDGAWTSVDANDLGRIGRQQNLLFAMLAAAKRLTVFDMLSVSRVLRAVGQHVRVDARLSDRQLVDFVLEARTLEREDIEIFSLPVTESREDGVSYLVAAGNAAADVYSSFIAGDGVPATDGLAVAGLRLMVLNGNGESGQAGRWRELLDSHGFTVVQVGDAGAFDFADTVVTVRADDLDKGAGVVEALGFGEVRQGSVDEGLDAVVVIGSDALGR